ncbi:TRAP transporter large permease [Marispirochaeta aestuarii]|uniref:TRAP transporter large permease n=1 Tax=Marispirochaeta aestuarii TaxID=1963862 RepID=UPI002ABD69A5|nr:TRAP transporter large permease [Marispirochaeta aestuarii]
MSLIVLLLTAAILLIFEFPVAFSLMGASIGYLAVDFFTGQGIPVSLTILARRMSPGLDSFPLLAMPLFILAGNLMNRSGIAESIFKFATSLFGHIRGGLAHVNIAASIVFAGMSGVAQADAAGLGTIEIEQMMKKGYKAPFAAAVTASSSIIGPIIPPSVIMVLYAVLAQVSLGELFLAGILPGILMGVLLMLLVYWMSLTNRADTPVEPASTLKEIFLSFVMALPALLAPMILVFGILFGFATPTELGAIAVFYAVVLGVINKRLGLKEIKEASLDSLVTFGVLIFIMAAAFPIGWIIAANNLPMHIANFILSISTNKIVVLILINMMLLIVGCFLETNAILFISVPALLPLIQMLGVDPVHFGVILVLNLLIGAITPPFGIILFIMMDIAKISFRSLLKEMRYFYVPLGISLLIITFVPDFVLFLPRVVAQAFGG